MVMLGLSLRPQGFRFSPFSLHLIFVSFCHVRPQWNA